MKPYSIRRKKKTTFPNNKSKTDPQGSYTGVPTSFEQPVQDADDL